MVVVAIPTYFPTPLTPPPYIYKPHKGLPPHIVTLSVLSPEVCPPEAVSVETSLNWRDDQFLYVKLPTALVGEWSVLFQSTHLFSFPMQLKTIDRCL